MNSQSKQSTESTFRERAIEHLFMGQLLKYFWKKNETNIEILRSEFDRGGYDVVVSKGNASRFIQFKTSIIGGKAKSVNVNASLMNKPNGCIVWIIVDEDLNLMTYRWFGSALNAPFPDLSNFRIAKHTKGNSIGVKTARPNIRVLPKTAFENISSFESLLAKLF
jgi:hypothetical protein